LNIRDCAIECHEISIKHGFWKVSQSIPEKLCLIHSEISEALEDYREDKMGHFGEELADATIRLFDLAVHEGIDIEDEIRRKMNKNIDRPYLHGKKL